MILRTHWTDFHDFFHQMIGIGVNMIELDLFSNSSRDVAMATNFGHNCQNDLYSAGWRS